MLIVFTLFRLDFTNIYRAFFGYRVEREYPRRPSRYQSEEIIKVAILDEKKTDGALYAKYIVPYNNQTMCQTIPGTKNWTFQCGVDCKDLKLTDIPTIKVDVTKSCSMLEAGVSRSFIANRTLFHVPFKSKCLKNLIRDHCSTMNAVPSIVHYVWFLKREMNFYHFLSFVSALRYIKPCLLLVHGDEPLGLYWEYIMVIANNVINVEMDPPLTIHNKSIGRIEHKADVARLLILQEYGGIYVDTDEIILRSLDSLLKFPFTLSHEFDNNLANGLILSSPNATFIYHWLDGYETFNNDQWAYHSTILPCELSKIYPNLIHVENRTFIRPSYVELPLIYQENFNWSQNYAMHLYIRFYKGMYTFSDARRLNTTLGSVARHVLYDTKELCYDK